MTIYFVRYSNTTIYDHTYMFALDVDEAHAIMSECLNCLSDGDDDLIIGHINIDDDEYELLDQYHGKTEVPPVVNDIVNRAYQAYLDKIKKLE